MLPDLMRPTIAALVVSGALTCAGCSGDSGTSPTILPGAPYTQTDVRVGTGTEAVAGRRATVHYTGWLYDPVLPENKGRQFDTSSGGQPYAFTVGVGQVIPGFDRGVTGMRVGGQRRVLIPPDLAYRDIGSGVIPPNATLVFDIELVDVS